MTTSITAAIHELEVNQRELEDLAFIIRDKKEREGMTDLLRQCFLLRMWLLERNIKTLEFMICDELEKIPLTNLISNTETHGS